MCSHSSPMFGNLLHRKNIPAPRGFGLIELLVSISIVMIVLAVVMVKNSSFSSAVVLRNQAYDVALSLRQAQLMAVSGNTAQPGEVQEYGVYAVTASTSILIFRDVNNNEIYDAGDTTAQVVKLDPGFEVRDVVNSTGASLAGTHLSITFTRPDFDATFKISSGVIAGPVNIEVSPVGATGDTVDKVRWVEITSPGQITVKPHINA